MPWKVRSPSTLYFLSPAFVKEVLLKVSVPYLAASKKSGLFKWLFLCSLLVLMLLMSAVSATEASEKSSLEEVIFASTLVKVPTMVAMARWEMAKFSWEWGLSQVQVCAKLAVARKNKAAVTIVIFFIV